MKRVLSYLMLLVLLLDAVPVAALAEELRQNAQPVVSDYSDAQQLGITLPEYTLAENEFTVSPVEDMDSLIAAVSRPVMMKKGLMKTAVRASVEEAPKPAVESVTG